MKLQKNKKASLAPALVPMIIFFVLTGIFLMSAFSALISGLIQGDSSSVGVVITLTIFAVLSAIFGVVFVFKLQKRRAHNKMIEERITMENPPMETQKAEASTTVKTQSISSKAQAETKEEKKESSSKKDLTLSNVVGSAISYGGGVAVNVANDVSYNDDLSSDAIVGSAISYGGGKAINIVGDGYYDDDENCVSASACDDDGNCCSAVVSNGNVCASVSSGNVTNSQDDLFPNDQSFFSDDVENVVIATDNYDVNVIVSDDNSFGYHISNCNKKKLFDFHSYVEGNTYDFRLTHKKKNSSGSGQVDIYVPNKYLNSIEINIVSGDANVDAYVNETHISSVSGDVNINTSSAIVEISSVSGDINVNAPASDINVTSVNGDVNLELRPERDGSLNVNATNGDINIQLEDAIYQGNIDTTTGDVEDSQGEGTYTLDGDITATSGDVTIDNE